MLLAAYLAGLFDGEGCVSVCSPRYKLSVSIGNQHLPILEMILEDYGGHIYHHSTVKGRINWVWKIFGHLSQPFLETILPFSIIKKEQIELGLFSLGGSKEDRIFVSQTLRENRLANASFDGRPN